MKIESCEIIKEYLIDMEGNHNRYRRGENGGWEELMGMSWETVMDYNVDELEKAFQEWITQNTPN